MKKFSKNLFSNKFLAGALVDERKCPKCLREFQCRYDKFGANFRPLLLHCGHSVCESCILLSRQQFICPICSKPEPLQNATRFKSFRNQFDLNCYMFGEICNYSFMRGILYNTTTDNNNVNMTLSTNHSSDSSITPCAECNDEAAVGSCPDCHAVYCYKCFQRIHAHSKILQTHNLQKFHTDLHIEHLSPRPVFCKKHKHVHDCYCNQCNINCCKMCIKQNHDKHHWHRLAEDNKQLRDEVLNVIEMIKISRDHLRTAQQEIATTQSKLETYASNAYKNIADYFLELHNFLQNEQRKIKEDYITQSQQPQKILNDAASKLERNQSMLKTMRVNLERYAKAPPNNLNVREILTFYNQQLRNMKCQMRVSKIMENPFVFDRVDIFKDEFKKSFFHAFVDPQIQIYYDAMPWQTTDMPDQTMLTLPPSPSLTNSSGSAGQVKNYAQKMFKNKKNNAQKCQITYEKKQLDFTDSFHPNSERNSSMGNSQNNVMARVTHLRHPQHFYIQQEQNLEQLNELSKNYQALENVQEKPKNIVLNNLYMIYYEPNMQWHRVLTKRQINRDTFEVFFVDIGQTLTVEKESFLELIPYATEIPHAAIRCSLHDLMPIGESWSDEAINFLKDIIKNQRIKIKIIEQDFDQYWKVDIIADENDTKISVRESFLYTGLGRALYPPSRTKRALLKYQIPKQILEATEILNVKMRHCENPQEFYVTKIDQIELKWALREEINNHYKKNSKIIKPIICGAISMGCVVLINDNEWHRGSIEEISDAGSIRVRLVDEGLVERLHWSRIFPLKPYFAKQREYALKCRLADIEPLQENNYEWSNEAIAEFKMLTTNPTLQMIICAGSQHEYIVILNVTRRSCSINIGAVLVKNGHGVSTGKNTMNSDIYRYTQEFINSIKSNSQNALDMTIEEDGDGHSKNESNTKLLKRTNVKMIYSKDPGHFYLQLHDLTPNIKKFQKQMQAAHEHLRKSTKDDNMEWMEGDHCLVTQIHHIDIDNSVVNFNLHESHWYRGVIANNCDSNPAAPFSVFLRDFGLTVENISDAQLFKISQEWDRISSAVIRCHLACIGPTSGEKEWSNTAIEYFKHTIKSFQQLSVTLHDKRDKTLQSTPIMLWGTISETFDPLAPCISRHSSINRVMVKAGLAHLTERFDLGKQLDQINANELSDGEISIQQWFKNFQDNVGLKIIDKVAEEEALMDIDNINETNYLPNNLIWNLEPTDILQTHMSNAAPKAWQEHKIIDKTLFVAYPTYVDSNCIIYLHHSDDHNLLSQITQHIGKSFANYLETTDISNYAIGQACIAKYHLDDNYYRGIVHGFNSNDMEYSVKFIDYGNVESVTANHMRPFAPFPEMPALASKYRLKDIAPKRYDMKFSTDVLDSIHSAVVGKMVNVRVENSESTDKIKTCHIRVGTTDLATFLHAEGLVEITLPKTNSHDLANECFELDAKQNKSTKPKNIDFGMKNILDKADANNDKYYTALFKRLESPKLDQRFDVNVPSAPLRKHMFANKDYANLCTVNDLKPSDINMLGGRKETSLEFNVEDEDDVDLLELGHTFCESFMIEDLNEDIKMMENDSLSSDKFFPKDTSTVSTFSGTECFKRSFLPNGIKAFFCQVVRIISPTILQILPELTEFQYRESELQLRIENAAKTALPLDNVSARSICLARYTKDNKYYRAVIRSINPVVQTADVLYVDYLNTETLPINQLLQCPNILATLPLRTFRVRLYGIKPNNKFSDRKVCRKLADCTGQDTLFARVRHRPCDADCEAGDLIQVTLHKSRETKTVIYSELLENEVYLRF